MASRRLVKFLPYRLAFFRRLQMILATELSQPLPFLLIDGRMFETATSAASRADPQRMGPFMAQVPMQRTAAPERLVGPIIFLFSTAASYVTDAILPVDGGYFVM